MDRVNNAERAGTERGLLLSPVLSIDTCGPEGSVALARVVDGEIVILGECVLGGRTYSARLVAAVGELLADAGVGLKDLSAMVAVYGPGSFTGVRVGLSAVKGLAEGARTPVAAVSRLEVLAAKAGVGSAALDAHRREVFLRIGEPAAEVRELLAGAEELAGVKPAPGRIAVCDEAAPALIATVWAGTEIVRCEAPTAGDALRVALARILAGKFVDLALLDGHYLRRSDAEIFGAGRAGEMHSATQGKP